MFSILTGTLYQIVLKLPKRRRLTSDEMHVGIGMLETGSSQRNVAKHLNVAQSVVSRMRNRYLTNGNAQHRHGGSHAKATSDIHDHYIGLLARRYRFRNATSLRNDFQNAPNVRVLTKTIRKRLHSSGLMAQRPAIHIPFTPYHIQERLDWARQHIGWTLNDRTPVLFTDESKFCIDFTDRRDSV